jgi:hypothetical protein
MKGLRPHLKKVWADLAESDFLRPQKSGFWWAEINNSLVFRPFFIRFWAGIAVVNIFWTRNLYFSDKLFQVSSH